MVKLVQGGEGNEIFYLLAVLLCHLKNLLTNRNIK